MNTRNTLVAKIFLSVAKKLLIHTLYPFTIQAAALLQQRNKAYNDFCEQNNLKKLNERITIAQWNRSQAAKARAAARRFNEEKKNEPT